MYEGIWNIKSIKYFCHIFTSVVLKVSLTTIAEIYNEDDHTINHHGFDRNVKGKGKIDETKPFKFMVIKFIGKLKQPYQIHKTFFIVFQNQKLSRLLQ